MLYQGAKFVFLLSSIILIGAIDAHGDESNKDWQLVCQSTQVDLASDQSSVESSNAGASSVLNQNNASTSQCLSGWRVDLRAELLYWYANQSGMAYTNREQSTFSTSDFSQGSLIDPTYHWEPGVRLDAAYGFDRSHWHLGADFIWYRGKGRGSQSTSVVNGLFPVWSFASDSLSSDYANSADISWTLYAMIFDVLAYYDWVCNSYFTLTASLGVRNAWLTEKATAHYEGGTYQAAPDIVNLRSYFYGIGPRLALRPKFLLGQGFSFYAEGAGAIFSGWFDVTQSEKFLSTRRAFLKRDVSGVRWGVDATSGFIYVYEIGSKSNISFDIGFDFMWFNRQNEFMHGSQFTLPSQGTSLMLYGGHAAVGYCF